MLTEITQNFRRGLILATRPKEANPVESSASKPWDNIAITPISELASALKESEHAFSLVPETMDKYAEILFKGNFDLALKALLAGKAADLYNPKYEPGGDWQFGIPQDAAKPENRQKARAYAEAVAAIHHLARYKNTQDPNLLTSLHHKQAFQITRSTLETAINRPLWTRRIANIQQ